MSEMVERVARALCRRQVMNNLGAEQWPEERIRAAVGCSWQSWTFAAQAAIKAMSEPTDAMIEAGEEEILCRRQAGAGVFAADIYAAMMKAE
jgi:hypothetical protein